MEYKLTNTGYHGQLVSASIVDPERSGVTSDWHQATRPHLTSSVTFALVASEATGHLQTGYIGLQVAVQRNPSYLADDCELIADSALGRHQRSHCSANSHSAWRREFFGGGTECMEQSSRHTAKTEHWIFAVQITFKGISVWQDCGVLVTFVYNVPCINWLTHSLTHSLTHILENY